MCHLTYDDLYSAFFRGKTKATPFRYNQKLITKNFQKPTIAASGGHTGPLYDLCFIIATHVSENTVTSSTFCQRISYII